MGGFATDSVWPLRDPARSGRMGLPDVVEKAAPDATGADPGRSVSAACPPGSGAGRGRKRRRRTAPSGRKG